MKRLALSFIVFCLFAIGGVVIAPTVYAQLASCCTALAAGGVTSLNTLTGDIALAVSGGTIGSVGQTITITVTPAPAPTPIPCPTAGSNVTITGTDLPSCTIAASSSIGLSNFATPQPTTSPNTVQNYAAVQGMQVNCNGAMQSPVVVTDCYAMFVVFNSIPGGGCENGYFNDVGTSSKTLLGVQANQLYIGCSGQPNTPHIAIGEDTNSSAAAPSYSMAIAGDFRLGGDVYAGTTTGMQWPGTSSTVQACGLLGTGGGAGVTYGHVTTGTCPWKWGDLAASSELCTDSSLNNVACSTLTTNVGELTCSVTSPATSCTAGSATVRSGAKCQLTYNGNDTTVSLASLRMPVPSLSSTTLTGALQTDGTVTGTLAANYNCP